MATKRKRDERITKRRVTMRSVEIRIDADGNELRVEQQAVDYMRPPYLDAYVADARTKWQHVEVSEEPDAGPGGYHGQTHVPVHLEVPDRGMTFEATEEGDAS